MQDERLMSKIPNPHDRYFRSAMSNLSVAREFFSAHLPDAVKAQIDFNSLVLKSESFIDKRLYQYYLDILYSVKFINGQGYLYLLTEHQSTPERFMAFRMLNYAVRIMEKHLSQSPGCELPIVVPLLFYNGERPYDQTRDL